MMINLYVCPQPSAFPKHGGVREHLVQLYKCAHNHPGVQLVQYPWDADVVHVESSYTSQVPPAIYTCHGGFLPPPPIPSVLRNLEQAKIIVSVAQWIVDEFFSQYAHKTVVIPNGIDLDEWQDIPSSGIEPGYILYAKEWPYYMDDFIRLAELMPQQRFVSTVWPDGIAVLKNVEILGLQSREVIRSVLKDAAALMLPGPEVCPTMLLEAWAAKTMVLAKNVAGSKEIMKRETRRGWRVAGGWLYDNVEDLYSYLRHDFGEWGDDFYRYVSGDGYHQVEARYQWKDLFERYVRLYEAIIENDLEKAKAA